MAEDVFISTFHFVVFFGRCFFSLAIHKQEPSRQHGRAREAAQFCVSKRRCFGAMPRPEENASSEWLRVSFSPASSACTAEIGYEAAPCRQDYLGWEVEEQDGISSVWYTRLGGFWQSGRRQPASMSVWSRAYSNAFVDLGIATVTREAMLHGSLNSSIMQNTPSLPCHALYCPVLCCRLPSWTTRGGMCARTQVTHHPDPVGGYICQPPIKTASASSSKPLRTKKGTGYRLSRSSLNEFSKIFFLHPACP